MLEFDKKCNSFIIFLSTIKLIMIKKTLITILSLLLISSSYANSPLKGDSVMTPNSGVYSGALQNNSQNIVTPGYTSTNTNEFHYGTCPAGFTYHGNSQYPFQVRTVTTYYLGGIYAGQSASGWSDLDFDCTKMEYQTIGCPTNYTGTQSQSRLVSTRDGALDYGAWNTYSSNCTYVPPVVCSYSRYSTYVGAIGEVVTKYKTYIFKINDQIIATFENQIEPPKFGKYSIGAYKRTDAEGTCAGPGCGGDGGDSQTIVAKYEICYSN